MPSFSSEYPLASEIAMKRATIFLTALAFTFGSGIAAEQYANIPPSIKCHQKMKDRSFCKRYPNFSLRHGICNPEPEILGHIEWSRRDTIVTEQDQDGYTESYEAVEITYRPVYENGAWGKPFTRTYRKEPTLITPPVIYK